MRFGRFFLFTGMQFAIAVGLFYLVAPTVLAKEIGHPWAILGWAFIFGLPLSLFEYIYHRYLLHSAVLPFLGSMHKAHTLHHSLTSVKAPVKGKAPEELVPVKSEYPVEYEHQVEAMEFPLYAVSIFLAIFTVLIGIPCKLMFPGSPAILAIFVGVTCFYSGYELWHAVLHLPYDQFWRPAMDHQKIGKPVRRIYAFHLMHHWRPSANLAIVGFWGVAVWDYAFRTHRRPGNLPLQGASVSYFDAAMKRPYWPIALLDRWQAGLYRWSRRVEAWSAQVFLRRKLSHAVVGSPTVDPIESEATPVGSGKSS